MILGGGFLEEDIEVADPADCGTGGGGEGGMEMTFGVVAVVTTLPL